MFIKNKKQIRLSFLLLISVFIFLSCSMLHQIEDSSSVTFSIDGEFIQKILSSEASPSRALSRTLSDEELNGLYFDVAIKGDYESKKTVAVKKGASVRFDDLEPGAVIYVTGEIYREVDGERITSYTGSSEKITIKEGENPISLKFTKIADEGEDPGSIVIYVSASAGLNDPDQDGSKNHPFAGIQQAINYIVDIGEPENAYTIKIDGKLENRATISDITSSSAKAITIMGANGLNTYGEPKDGLETDFGLSIKINDLGLPITFKNIFIRNSYMGLVIGDEQEPGDYSSDVILEKGTLIEGNEIGVCLYPNNYLSVKKGVKIRNNTSNETYAGIWYYGTVYLSGGKFGGNVSEENGSDEESIDLLQGFESSSLYVCGELSESSSIGICVYDSVQPGTTVVIKSDDISADVFAAQCAKMKPFQYSGFAEKINSEGRLEEMLLTTLYVSAQGYNDTRGWGTLEKPFKTIERAGEYIYNHPDSEKAYVIKICGEVTRESDSFCGLHNISSSDAKSILIEGNTGLKNGVPQDVIKKTSDADAEALFIRVPEVIPVTLKNVKITGDGDGLSVGNSDPDDEIASYVILDSGVLIEGNGKEDGYRHSGIYVTHASTVEIREGCVIRNNKGTDGKAVYIDDNDSTIVLSGASVIDSSNDVFLWGTAKITIAGPLTANPVATISVPECMDPSSSASMHYEPVLQIKPGANVLLSQVYNRFRVVDDYMNGDTYNCSLDENGYIH